MKITVKKIQTRNLLIGQFRSRLLAFALVFVSLHCAYSFQLPSATPAAAGIAPERLARMDAVSSKRILIVEDENDVVDLLTLNLRKAGGFLVSKAGDGASGLTKARAEKPDFICWLLLIPLGFCT